MPISKEDALQAAEERDDAAFDTLCADIDARLKNDASKGPVPIFMRDTSSLVERVKEAYIAAGWTCSVSGDQREGTTLTFS